MSDEVTVATDESSKLYARTGTSSSGGRALVKRTECRGFKSQKLLS